MLRILSHLIGTQLPLLNVLICTSCWLCCMNLARRGNEKRLPLAGSNGVCWHVMVLVHTVPPVFHSRRILCALLCGPVYIVNNVFFGLIILTIDFDKYIRSCYVVPEILFLPVVH